MLISRNVTVAGSVLWNEMLLFLKNLNHASCYSSSTLTRTKISSMKATQYGTAGRYAVV